MDSPSTSPAPSRHNGVSSGESNEDPAPQQGPSVTKSPNKDEEEERDGEKRDDGCSSLARSVGSGSSDSDSDSSSSSEDEQHVAMRKIRSSVAQITCSTEQQPPDVIEPDNFRSRSRDRSKSKSREQDRSRSRSMERSRGRDRSRSRERERSRGRDRSKSRERHHYDRGRHPRDRYHDEGSRRRERDHGGRGRSPSPSADGQPASSHEPLAKKKKEELDPILTRTGGAYIPPAKLRLMQQQITDKTSLAYQRMSWEALKKSINGLINKVNVSNIVNIIQEILQENIVRGRGLLARSVLQAQSASPIFTHVYAAVVAIINSKFPQIGELILKRLILTFRRGYRRNVKQQCLTSSKFVAHLINQNVAHEVLCLEMLTLLLERPTDDSVEVAIAFLKECGLKLTDVSPRGINAIFERLRNILHESAIDKRVQYMIEVMFAIRKDGFKDHPVIPEGLDLVDEDDQFTHMLPLDDEYNTDDVLNVFKMDPNFQENEEKYKTLKRDILDEGSSDSGEEGDSEDDEDDEDGDDKQEGEDEKVTILDQTEVNLVAFRRTIYLVIQSSLDFEECAHKLIKMEFPDSQTKELCNMILDCCAQQRTYEKFFGLLAGRFCLLKKEYMESFEAIFSEQYETIHRLETNKLRNVARLFAHLLYTDSIPWSVLECIKISEETTTSSSRIFVKILFQELCAYMGLPRLNQRFKDITLQTFFEGLFPRDNPRNTRFAINFFTSIGLGGLTDELREHLKNAPKMIMTQNQEVESSDSSSSSDTSSSSSSGSSSDSSSDSDSSSSSSSSSSDSDAKHRKKKKRQKGQSDKKKKKEKAKRKKNFDPKGDMKGRGRREEESIGSRKKEGTRGGEDRRKREEEKRGRDEEKNRGRDVSSRRDGDDRRARREEDKRGREEDKRRREDEKRGRGREEERNKENRDGNRDDRRQR
ncbi:pre-mRNA-splicing factor CWC22 homolog [Syngnathoides biaculeatus]|uniref:pre-mRNA-splicing factor CWC22 homolog n=1 Tax=Syngnathoides biaculeatus TaxID=300417 RepID=UPI002ADE1DC2|nr:pre-mRNA-splicing factor CWC22 homolog [Syngnathoides biaculeatus]